MVCTLLPHREKRVLKDFKAVCVCPPGYVKENGKCIEQCEVIGNVKQALKYNYKCENNYKLGSRSPIFDCLPGYIKVDKYKKNSARPERFECVASRYPIKSPRIVMSLSPEAYATIHGPLLRRRRAVPPTEDPLDIPESVGGETQCRDTVDPRGKRSSGLQT